MINRLPLFLVFLPVLLLCAKRGEDIAGTTTETTSGCVITGMIIDGDSSRISDAVVVLHDQRPVKQGKLAKRTALIRSGSTRTGDDGYFRFDSVDTGGYLLEVNGRDTLGVLLKASVEKGDTLVELSGLLLQTGTIIGKVDTETIGNLPSVEVNLPEIHKSVPVDSTGQFIFTGIPAWDYLITVSKGDSVFDFPEGSGSIPVSPGDTTIISRLGVSTVTVIINSEIIERDTETILTDADGNMYQTVQIGNQEWMAENLRTTKYNDGEPIPNIISDATWDSCNYTEIGAYCYFENTTDSDSIKKYGALYNWYAVNTGKLAPAGWHVPADSEWTILENYLITNGYTYDGTTTGNKIAKAMAAKTDWAASEVEGTIGNDLSTNNKSGFSALPGGYRDSKSNFFNQGYIGLWWSAPEYNASNSSCPYLDNVSESLHRYNFNMGCGCSVRLLRD